MAGVDRAVGVLDDDAVDGQIDVGHFPYSEILTEGGAGDPFDLAGREPAAEPDGLFERFGDKTFVDAGFWDGAENRFLEVEFIGVAGLDDEFFSAAAVEPSVEDFVFDVERFGKAVPVERAAFFSEEVEDFKLLRCCVGCDAISKTVGLFPVLGVDDHFTVCQIPENYAFMRLVIRGGVFHFHEQIRKKLDDRFEIPVAHVFEKIAPVLFHDLAGGITDFQRVEMADIEDGGHFGFDIGMVVGRHPNGAASHQNRKNCREDLHLFCL